MHALRALKALGPHTLVCHSHTVTSQRMTHTTCLCTAPGIGQPFYCQHSTPEGGHLEDNTLQQQEPNSVQVTPTMRCVHDSVSLWVCVDEPFCAVLCCAVLCCAVLCCAKVP